MVNTCTYGRVNTTGDNKERRPTDLLGFEEGIDKNYLTLTMAQILGGKLKLTTVNSKVQK